MSNKNVSPSSIEPDDYFHLGKESYVDNSLTEQPSLYAENLVLNSDGTVGMFMQNAKLYPFKVEGDRVYYGNPVEPLPEANIRFDTLRNSGTFYSDLAISADGNVGVIAFGAEGSGNKGVVFIVNIDLATMTATITDTFSPSSASTPITKLQAAVQISDDGSRVILGAQSLFSPQIGVLIGVNINLTTMKFEDDFVMVDSGTLGISSSFGESLRWSADGTTAVSRGYSTSNILQLIDTSGGMLAEGGRTGVPSNRLSDFTISGDGSKIMTFVSGAATSFFIYTVSGNTVSERTEIFYATGQATARYWGILCDNGVDIMYRYQDIDNNSYICICSLNETNDGLIVHADVPVPVGNAIGAFSSDGRKGVIMHDGVIKPFEFKKEPVAQVEMINDISFNVRDFPEKSDQSFVMENGKWVNVDELHVKINGAYEPKFMAENGNQIVFNIRQTGEATKKTPIFAVNVAAELTATISTVSGNIPTVGEVSWEHRVNGGNWENSMFISPDRLVTDFVFTGNRSDILEIRCTVISTFGTNTLHLYPLISQYEYNPGIRNEKISIRPSIDGYPLAVSKDGKVAAMAVNDSGSWQGLNSFSIENARIKYETNNDSMYNSGKNIRNVYLVDDGDFGIWFNQPDEKYGAFVLRDGEFALYGENTLSGIRNIAINGDGTVGVLSTETGGDNGDGELYPFTLTRDGVFTLGTPASPPRDVDNNPIYNFGTYALRMTGGEVSPGLYGGIWGDKYNKIGTDSWGGGVGLFATDGSTVTFGEQVKGKHPGAQLGGAVAISSDGTQVFVSALGEVLDPDILPTAEGAIYAYDADFSTLSLVESDKSNVYASIDGNYGRRIECSDDGTRLAIIAYNDNYFIVFDTTGNKFNDYELHTVVGEWDLNGSNIDTMGMSGDGKTIFISIDNEFYEVYQS